MLDHGIAEDLMDPFAQLENAPDPDEDWELGELAPTEDDNGEDFFEEEAESGL